MLTKLKKIGWGFLFGFFTLSTYAQVTDDFSDGNFTANPNWSGETTKFEVLAGQLHLNDVAAGEAYLSTPSEAIANAEWDFRVEIAENPSSTNFTSVYLVSDQADLSGSLNGYFVKVGNTSDEVSLYRQDGSTQTEIIDGLDDRVDVKPVQIEIKVTRDAAGNWELSSRSVGDTNFSVEGLVQDDTYTVSGYFGVYCKYTATRSDAFYFDNILVTGTPQPDTQKPQITNLSVQSGTQLRVQFSEAVSSVTAEVATNYMIVGHTIASATLTGNQVDLTINPVLINATDYALEVRNVEDGAANLLADTTLNFFYFEEVPAQWNNVIISELMPDPNPVKADLPDAEFVELYNRSEHPFDLQNWTLNDKPLPAYILRPQQFVILCPQADSASFTPFGKVLPLDSWPTLSNSGSQLLLRDDTSAAVDSISYTAAEVDGGVSLERISEEMPCDQRINLALSTAEQGATPGQTNTIISVEDTDSPVLLKIQPNSNLLELIFDERVALPDSESIKLEPSLTISQIVRDTVDEKILWVILAESLTTNTNYSLTFLNAEDCYGNVNPLQTTSFYFDNQPPTLQQVIVRDTAEVNLVFSEKLSESVAKNEDHYLLMPGSIPAKETTLGEDSSSVWLEFPYSLADGIVRQLQVHSLEDIYGNSIDTVETELFYQQDIDTVIVRSEYQLDVYLSEAVSTESAQQSSVFAVNREVGHSITSFRDSDQSNQIHLVFSQPLTPNREHELLVGQLFDTQEQLLSTPIYRFYFDRRAPRIDSVQAIDEETLLVYFDEPLDSLTTINPLHYELNSDTIEIIQVALLDNARLVQLTLSESLVPEVEYELEVLGIADESGNTISSQVSKTFIFDQLPPKLSSWKIINPYQLRLYFSEAIRTPAASDFEVVAIGILDSILVSQIQPNEVRLFFAKPLSFSESVLNMNNITDLRGNRQQTPSQVAIDNAAVTLGLITALSSTELRLDFTHSLDEATMLDPARYRIDQTDSPINVTAELSYVLHLTLGQAFQPDATYELSIDQIVNVEGQTFDGILDSFTYQTQIEYIQAEQRALVLHFQIPLDSTDAVKAEHYHLDDFPPVAVLRVDERKVRLVFDQSLEPLTRYELAVEGLRTIDGDIIPVSVHSVGLGRSPNFNELLITEIMADPTPTVGLPNAEYLEFYNASDDLLDISGIRLSDATSSTLLPSTLLLPGEYLIVCAHQDQPKLSAYGRSLGVSSFPSLNSSGDQISLTNFYGGEIFSVSYSDDWYNDAEKKQGGWSLEMVDYTRPCGEQENWTASVASAGGTPGQGNSVNQPNPDNQSPYLQVAFAESPTEVSLLFSEKLDPSSFESGRVSISNDVAVDTVMWQTGGKSATVHLIDSLQVRITYTVQVSQLSDCSGNMVDNQAISLVLSEEAAPGDVLLSEILFYPRSGGVRFVEIYNNSDKPINLKGWQLANLEGDSLTNQSLITDENYQLAPQQYVALTEDIITLMGDYPVATEGNLLQVEDLPSLPSDAGNVTLLSPSGEPMQYLAYDEDWHHPILDDVRGVSLERISWETEVNDPNNWQSAAQTVGFATPGYANSQTVKASLTQAALSVEPRVFTPDQDGFQDYTQILYRWPNAGNVANVIIFDSQGRKVKHLARNTILSEEGFLRWDGTDDAGQQLSMGYYIIYFEVFHTNGQVSGLKERVVLGRPF